MWEKKYEVIMDKTVVAKGMDLKTATLMVRALFEEYYNEYPLTISVREMERVGCVQNENI